MGENSRIEWCDHTFNPWVGCTAVSPACDHCYAEGWAKRSGLVGWGAHAPRRRTKTWGNPVKWNRRAADTATRARVFCASLADVFDNHRSIEAGWRDDLWALIRATPNLDWLLLTKRPQNVRRYLPADWENGWENVWLGTTVENQAEADRRIPALLDVPARVHFLSCEPLLGPVDIMPYLHDEDCNLAGKECSCRDEGGPFERTVGWVIAGGESGPNARPTRPAWFRRLRDQCAASGVPFHFKQHGDWIGVPDLRGLPGVAEAPGFGPFDHCAHDLDASAVRVGKKAAGRLLDGAEHNGMPA